MERPLWVLIIGLLMIFVGGCGGIANDIKQINAKALMEFQTDLLQELNKEVGNEKLDPNQLKIIKSIVPDTISKDLDENLSGEELSSIVTSISHISPQAQSLFIKHGYLGIGICSVSIILGLLLIFKRNPLIPKLCMCQFIISILFSFFQVHELKAVEMSPIFKEGVNFALYLGASFDMSLLVLLGVFKSDEYFLPIEAEEATHITHRDN